MYGPIDDKKMAMLCVLIDTNRDEVIQIEELDTFTGYGTPLYRSFVDTGR